MITEKNDNKQRVKLDEILKSLFNVSKKVLIQMLNSLFKETHDIDSTHISFENGEFISDAYDTIKGDLFLKMLSGSKPFQYHIELQTKNDNNMVIRMFEYAFYKAKEISRCEGRKDIYIPKQLVIFIEQNNSIKDALELKIIFPDEQEIYYTVPVMKYWEYDDKRLIKEKMYPLLPLQVFKLRYRMDKIAKIKRNTNEMMNDVVLEAKQTAEIVAKEGKELYDQGEITGEDLDKILLAIGDLFKYLNKKYGDDEKLDEEVFTMTRTLFDPAVEERGIIKGKKEGRLEGKLEGLQEGVLEGRKEVAKKLILLGDDMEKIIIATELPEEEIKKLYNLCSEDEKEKYHIK